ncbi:site-specific DNA-methyltransferase, partial [candidate division KSB3 bacterium]|nr:site-specific DNA-methyltransferase [candidate division KSB3 bacterium]MBD3326505.1 site-specific DNA-methyltransferase [candidate division KSB3 bacterium]
MTYVPFQSNQILHGEAQATLRSFPPHSIDCAVTSPPYFHLRDYGVAGQVGLESTVEEYLDRLCRIFDEVKRVLKPQGTCWVNMGDTYGGSGGSHGQIGSSKTPDNQRTTRQKRHTGRNTAPKCLLQIPARFGIAMCARGWILRNEIIWQKPNGMPTSAKDRFTVDFEKLFFFVKSPRYYFKQQLEPYTHPINRWGGNQVKPYQGKFQAYATTADRSRGSRAKLQPPQGASFERARRVRPNPRGRNKRCVWS